MAALAGTSLEGVALAPDLNVSHADIGVDQLSFFKAVLCELVGTLEDTVGPVEAAGYTNIVASHVADWLNTTYHRALGADEFSVERVAHILADLKTRINGQFTVRSVSPDKIVLTNTAGLFGHLGHGAMGQHTLCVMTSTVFGRFAAENTGYARIEHLETCADGRPGCDVAIHFRPSHSVRPGEQEYYRVHALDFG